VSLSVCSLNSNVIWFVVTKVPGHYIKRDFVAVHTTKEYRGVEVKIHSFLTLAPNESEWSNSRSGRFNPKKTKPGTYWIGSWVSPQMHSRRFGEEKISCPYEDSNTQQSSPWPSTYTDWVIQPLLWIPYWAAQRRHILPVYQFIRCLFNDAVSNSDCIALKCRNIGGHWIRAWTKYNLWCSPNSMCSDRRKPQNASIWTHLQVKIWKLDLLKQQQVS
jgi:hypothetical protein